MLQVHRFYWGDAKLNLIFLILSAQVPANDELNKAINEDYGWNAVNK